MRTSFAAGHPQVSWRSGYRVIRKAGRHLVFPRAAFSEMMGWHGGRDGLVEIWNGMPFFSPVWARTPRVVWLHHIHADMWKMTLPPKVAAVGNWIESSFAPKLYHWTQIVTLSESSKAELIDDLGFSAKRVTVVPPGIDARFSSSPDVAKSKTPLVVAVGRLVPVKRFDLLLKALFDLRKRIPTLRAVIVGEGYERERLDAMIAEHGAREWLLLPGRLSDADLVDLYRRAWVVASMSVREGWGMTVTEAAACGTPAVATRIAGHLDSVVEGRSGVLIDDVTGMTNALARVIESDELREQLGRGALEQAQRFTWENTALGTLEVLAGDALRRRARR